MNTRHECVIGISICTYLLKGYVLLWSLEGCLSTSTYHSLSYQEAERPAAKVWIKQEVVLRMPPVVLQSLCLKYRVLACLVISC